MPLDNNGTIRVFDVEGVASVPYKTEDFNYATTKKKLTLDRKKILETILSREKNREKRSKLHGVLLQKLSKKYGSENSSKISVVINEFLLKHEKISGDDLKLLEKETDEAIKSYQHSRQNANKLESVNANNKTKTNEESTSTSTLPLKLPVSEWKIIQAYQAVVGEDETIKEKERLIQKKRLFKQNLDSHVHLVEQNKANDNNDDRNYAEYVRKDIEKYHQEEAEKANVIKSKYLEEKKIREEQILDNQRRAFGERETFKLDEIKQLKIVDEAIERDRLAQLEAKMKEKQRQAEIVEENNLNLLRRAERKKAEALEDFRLMKEYEMKLDREAYERDHLFQKRIQHLEAIAKKYHHEGAGKNERENELKFEISLLKEIQRKEEFDKLDEERRKENKKKRELAAAKANAELLERKRQAELLNRQQDQLFAKQFREDTLNYQNKLFNDKKEAFRNKIKYRSLLDEHMTLRKQEDINLEGMVEREKRINGPFLRKIVSNHDVYKRILSKLNVKTDADATTKSDFAVPRNAATR